MKEWSEGDATGGEEGKEVGDWGALANWEGINLNRNQRKSTLKFKKFKIRGLVAFAKL
jgi:hypothetical protein